MVKNMVKKITGMFAFCAFFILGGCMYPAENRQDYAVPYEEQVNDVQKAVDLYQKEHEGLLPIQTKSQDTPYYVKYIVDFNKLVPKYLPEIPGNAFEKGGIFQYTIINEEKDPTVKLIDVRIAEKIKETKMKILTQGYPAFGEKLGEGVFSLNYKKMGFEEEPTVRSPFTGQTLYLVMAGDGEIYVDYTPDLLKIGVSDVKLAKNTDIRRVLTENSMFVPAFSLPYTWDEQQKKPVFLSNEE